MSAIPTPNLTHAACLRSAPTKALCERCYCRPECLAWALEHEPSDLWGGHDAAERRQLREQYGITLLPIKDFGFALRGAR